MVQRSCPSPCWCKVERLRTALAERCHLQSTRTCPLQPRCALAAPSPTSCLTAHRGSQKHRPKPGDRPGTGYTQHRSQVRFRWWPGAQRGCDRPVPAGPCCARAGGGTAAAAGTGARSHLWPTTGSRCPTRQQDCFASLHLS